jgi:secreted PhoX family phosphatase
MKKTNELSADFLFSMDINPNTRREFLRFIGRSAATAGLIGMLPALEGCATSGSASSLKSAAVKGLPFTPLAPTSEDVLKLADGFKYGVVAKWNDPITSKEVFGMNNDFLAFFPLNEAGNDGILWCNHEYFVPLLASGYTGGPRTKEQVEKEQLVVGGSLIRIKRNDNGDWSMVAGDGYNRRLNALTPIPIIASRAIDGKRVAQGTFANCAGGVTPWGTVLTCEENYQDYYGEYVYSSGKRVHEKGKYGWHEIFPNISPEHYGWVVEVDPLTGKAKKHTALGRFSHEAATVRPLPDGRVVVYSGDDAENRCLYKFISDKPGSLDSGTLYVANVEQGRWIPLTIRAHKVLRSFFKDQLEVMIRCREAAFMIGGSALARPEDIEIDPITGAVYIALTMLQSRGNNFGSIMKLEEKGGDPAALEFTSSTFATGGTESGFACPDNMAFDRKGNLWMTNDISGKQIGQGVYEPFKNNGLFYIPLHGENAGRAFRVASAPVEAELTGPTFSADGKTLFLSVQHPGEESKSLDTLTSHWPEGGTSIPRSAVVAIQGPALDQLTAGDAVKPLFEVPVLKAKT